MPKLIKFLPILAIVAGVSAALAFSAPDEQYVQTTYWFSVDEDGDIIQYESAPSCPGDEILCAVAFDEQDVDLSGATPESLIDHVSEADPSTDPDDSGVQIIAEDYKADL